MNSSRTQPPPLPPRPSDQLPQQPAPDPASPPGPRRLPTVSEPPLDGATRYGEVSCRSVLNAISPAAVRALDLPFEHSINPYQGCELACAYCFARDFDARRRPSAQTAAAPPAPAQPAPADPFAQRVLAKADAAELLRGELRRQTAAGRGWRSRSIVLGTATDPYQPLERRQRLTRSLLRVLLEEAQRLRVPSDQEGRDREGRDQAGPRLTIATKSDLVLEDLPLLRELAQVGHLRVRISLPSLDRALLQVLEPGAPSPARRLRAVEALSRAGIPCGIDCAPILPGLTDSSRDLRALTCAASSAGAAFLAARLLVLRGEHARRALFAALERVPTSRCTSHWRSPAALSAYYRRLYRSAHAPDEVQDRLQRLLQALRRQYRMPAELPFPAPSTPVQLPLFALDPRAAAQAGSKEREDAA